MSDKGLAEDLLPNHLQTLKREKLKLQIRVLRLQHEYYTQALKKISLNLWNLYFDWPLALFTTLISVCLVKVYEKNLLTAYMSYTFLSLYMVIKKLGVILKSKK